MHWSSKQKVRFNISARKCTTKTSDQHKHCAMQLFVTAFEGHMGRHFWMGAEAPFSLPQKNSPWHLGFRLYRICRHHDLDFSMDFGRHAFHPSHVRQNRRFTR